MNAIFLTQSGSLRPFYELMTALRKPLQLEKVGFLVASHNYFQRFREQVPDIESGRYYLLKEWEVSQIARGLVPDGALIGRYESQLGNPYLWGPLVADRRIYLGKRVSLFQDYRSRFRHHDMLRLLQAGLESVEALFDQVQPDIVVSFVCVTYCEYLSYLFAKSRGVRFLNLRPTRIENYVTYGESIFEPSERVRDVYERYHTGHAEDEWVEKAREHIEFAQTQHALYEGVGISGLPRRARGDLLKRLPPAISRAIGAEIRYRFGPVSDNHDNGVFTPLVYTRLLKPLRKLRIRRSLSAHYISENDLPSMNYVFFPLHKEPENTLHVFSRPYLNQIEVIRNISHSIPVGATLVVKEHPASVGMRSMAYYRKILDIPNVRLADPEIRSRSLSANASLVAVIAGSVGWEALLLGKPVITFGRTPYEFLPRSMVRRVTDLEALAHEISDLISGYRYDEHAVIAYVASTMSQSAAINWYSRLLGREGAYSIGIDAEGIDGERRANIERLARYTVETLGTGTSDD